MTLRSLFYSLPPTWRFVARRIWYWPSDTLRRFTGQQNDLIPPKGMIFTGSGDFERDGKILLDQFVRYANLQSDHRVLDIGSGIGRIAIPMTQFLDKKGRYEGFDVVEKGVDWCKKHISSRFSNFNFRFIPLKNDLYTDTGADAAQFSFPYDDRQFDFACSISVFTHMLPEEVQRYFVELNRVLDVEGRVFATFFIVNEVVRPDSNPKFVFGVDHGHYALMDGQVQAANVAFDEKWLRAAIERSGLELENVFYGFWTGRKKEDCLNFQDVLILRKK